MINPHLGEAVFEFAGEKYTLVFDYAAIAFYEEISNESIMLFYDDLARMKIGGALIKVTKMAKFVLAGLLKFHSGLTEDDVLPMLSDVNVLMALGRSNERSNPPMNDAKEVKPGGNVPPIRKRRTPIPKKPKKPI